MDGLPVSTVAVAGLGSVGLRVAQALDAGDVPGMRLVAVSARTAAPGDRRMASFSDAVALTPLDRMAMLAEIVVECLPPARFAELAAPVVSTPGRTLVVASVGALLTAGPLLETARQTGVRILAPSGAVAGLDGVRAARLAGLTRVRLVTRKPPAAFGVSAGDGAAVLLFDGTARQAVDRFPKNINVAATVSLAGLGPDRTEVQIWADPAVTENRHELQVWSAAGTMTATTVNRPDPANPKSSAVTGHSLLAALRRLTDPVSVGS